VHENFSVIKFNVQITGTPHPRIIHSDHRGGLEEHHITKWPCFFPAEMGNGHMSWKRSLQATHLRCSCVLPTVWQWHMGNITSLCPQAYKAMPGQPLGSRCRMRLSLPGSKVTPAAQHGPHAQPGVGSCHADHTYRRPSCPLTAQPEGPSPACLQTLEPTQSHVLPPAKHSHPHPLQPWIISLAQSLRHRCRIQLAASTVASKQGEQQGPAVGPMLLKLGTRKITAELQPVALRQGKTICF